MMNYKSAFDRGMEEARNRKEQSAKIEETLNSFFHAIFTLSGNKVKAALEPSPLYNRSNDSGYGLYLEPRSRSRIILKGQTPNPMTYTIAEFCKSGEGFPCELVFDQQSVVCFTEDELTVALEALLASRDTGNAITSIIEETVIVPAQAPNNMQTQG